MPLSESWTVRLWQLRAQMPRHDVIADGLGPDGVWSDLPVAEPDDERLPARPQQLAQRPAHGAHGI